MAHSAHTGTYGQFSVIGRLREGTVSSLSTYGVILEIQRHLNRYKSICNVAFSPPNYIIHLPTVELQLQILSLKAFTGPDYVLDLVPWSSEYTSFDLPWIIRSFDANGESQIQGDSATINNPDTIIIEVPKDAVGSSLLHHTSHTQTDAELSKIRGSSSTQSVADNSRGLLCKGIKIKLNTIPHAEDSEMPIDFSYLMIAELKNFYFQKFRAFENCNQICKEMYGIAQAFSKKVERAVGSIYETINSTGIGENIFSHAARNSGDPNNTLWFMSEEIFGLHITMTSICDSTTNAIDLTKFFNDQSNQQVTEPVIAAGFLKATAEFAVSQIHGRHLLVATEEKLTGAFHTQIWCVYFHHQYKAVMSVTKEQAEANAIYRFLKYLTNVIGYSIEDYNSDTLYTMVSQINHLGISISELQICVDKVTAMVNHVTKTMRDIFTLNPNHISGAKLDDVSAQINDLFALLQHYDSMVLSASENFQHHKQILRSIKFRSAYPSMSD